MASGMPRSVSAGKRKATPCTKTALAAWAKTPRPSMDHRRADWIGGTVVIAFTSISLFGIQFPFSEQRYSRYTLRAITFPEWIVELLTIGGIRLVTGG
ncbi:hypothetical protein GCM10023319_29260 [Nocardia iowensis]